MSPRLTSTIRAAVLAGLAGGAADILAAFVIYRSATPLQILQSIAAGLQGAAACGRGAEAYVQAWPAPRSAWPAIS